MAHSKRPTRPDQMPEPQPGPDDPGLAGLRQAEVCYRDLYARVAGQVTEAERAREAAEKLKQDLDAQRAQLNAERQRAEQQAMRAAALASALKDIHRALFSGNIYDLILKACLTLTGATRGLYITARAPDAALHVRAAVDVDAYPQAPASPFIQALCRAVLVSEDTLVSNDPPTLPERPDPGERFRNCVVAPVVLLSALNGVIIVADKVSGDFDEDDAETLVSIGNQAAVAVQNGRLHRELQHAYLAIVGVLADALASKDPQAQGRYERAARDAHRVAERLGLSEYDRSVVYYAALLHDIGNIGVSDGVLNKPGALLDVERDLIRVHIRVGHDLLQPLPALEPVADAILHHHEWYDGSGYPDRLSGDAIPIAARIVAVVDAYSAMLALRSYRPAHTEERARAELRAGAGTQFDPDVVAAFLLVLDEPEAPAQAGEEQANEAVLPGLGALRDAIQ